ncbi:RNA-binding S4 domain-containing protein [Draconibacterium halophilum]|uniref:RNA-binding S4 domain-containing protein n=1 Tax=Draconibacterium halophilum TaxID=2706887 RepID=A0A6C0RHC1_9BACT|nr:RNA-binding S4 domain-containing protein [Draconibacterium halophilum]QIA08933.1 RNA-binding S4 domain-containing protein [Draconibacterium halophilum]
MTQGVRIDKWLWVVRIFKTRSQATEACKKGHITIDDVAVKASREVHVGEVIKVRKSPITKSFKVLALSGKRMGAKLVSDFLEDVTPLEEIELLEMQKHMRWSAREKGTGRPTKKDRRDLDDFFDW